ncbi:MAG: DUF2796 domain-containing protein [Gammaproteobacteria bacterium]|nr:DUF2796 domain-containing protein [Gammaproteobacteria bacterium]
MTTANRVHHGTRSSSSGTSVRRLPNPAWVVFLVAVFILVFAVSRGFADEDDTFGHEHGKHEHGAVTFNIALDGDTLLLELDAPAINVLGFERAPRNDAERKLVTNAHAWLAGGREMLRVPSNAACRLQSANFTAPKLGTGHADYQPRYAFRCSNPAALVWVEVWALRKLKEVERAQVNLITPQAQRQQTLQGGELRVPLK